MIIPCIDLMDGKVVQLVQGREKVLERSADEMLELFQGFEQLQVIDLDAAMNRGSNDALMKHAASRATVRAGGGVRTVERAVQLIKQGAYRVIIGTAAFSATGPSFQFLGALAREVGRQRITVALDSRDGHIVLHGWTQTTPWTALEMIHELEPFCSGFLCTYVDREGMMQGTDLPWFQSLRHATDQELIAAGGITTLEDVKALSAMEIHCAIGMSIYTGKLKLSDLRAFLRNEMPQS